MSSMMTRSIRPRRKTPRLKVVGSIEPPLRRRLATLPTGCHQEIEIWTKAEFEATPLWMLVDFEVFRIPGDFIIGFRAIDRKEHNEINKANLDYREFRQGYTEDVYEASLI
jgi:hypothetical protein